MFTLKAEIPVEFDTIVDRRTVIHEFALESDEQLVANDRLGGDFAYLFAKSGPLPVTCGYAFVGTPAAGKPVNVFAVMRTPIGPPTQLALTTQPGGGKAGAAWAQQPGVGPGRARQRCDVGVGCRPHARRPTSMRSR